MTHTVHPYAHRLGIIRDWRSRWFAGDKKSYRENIKIDETIRVFLKKRLKGMHVAEVEIERTQSEIRVLVHTARPGLVIGRSGENAAKLRKELTDLVRKIAELTGTKAALEIGVLPNRPTEIWRMYADNTRARAVLDWEPLISLEEGLKKTIEWFREYLPQLHRHHDQAKVGGQSK